MRSIRKAAVAGAAAIALTLGSTSVAVAQDAPTMGEKEPVATTEGNGSLSSTINNDLNLEGDQAANGTALFGSSKDGFGEQPLWAQLLYGATVAGAIATFVGTIVGPVYNFIHHGPHNLF